MYYSGNIKLVLMCASDDASVEEFSDTVSRFPVKHDPRKSGLEAVVHRFIRRGRMDLLEAALQRGYEMHGRPLSEEEITKQVYPGMTWAPTSFALASCRPYASTQVIRQLVRHGGDATWDDCNPREVPIILASDPDCVRLLIELGCSSNARISRQFARKSGYGLKITSATALHSKVFALYCDRSKFSPTPADTVQCAAELLAADADPCARTAEGWTTLKALRHRRCPPVPCLEKALERCEGDSRKCLQLLFDHDYDGWLARRRLVHPRVRAMLDHRRAHEAHRDARLLFQAAAEGRPMELAKRMVLGKLAGGLDAVYQVKGEAGELRAMTALEAARMGGHEECARIASDELCLMGRGRL